MAEIKPESFDGKTWFVLYVGGSACWRFEFLTEARMEVMNLGLEVRE